MKLPNPTQLQTEHLKQLSKQEKALLCICKIGGTNGRDPKCPVCN